MVAFAGIHPSMSSSCTGGRRVPNVSFHNERHHCFTLPGASFHVDTSTSGSRIYEKLSTIREHSSPLGVDDVWIGKDFHISYIGTRDGVLDFCLAYTFVDVGVPHVDTQ